jgi:hypothetical protein
VSWLGRHWVPIAIGIGGFGVGCVVGWAGIGDGSIEWGTAGEWAGGVGATLAVLWAVWAFLQERETNQRRYPEMVRLSIDWVRRDEPGLVRAHVRVDNRAPVDMDQVVVSAVVNGVTQHRAQLALGSHAIGPSTGRPFDLFWHDSAG